MEAQGPSRSDQSGIYIPSDEFVQIAACVFDRISVGTLITDAHGTIVSVNPAFTALTGYSREEAIGKKPSILQSGRQGKDFYVDMWKTLQAQGYWSGIVWNRKKDGAHYAELLTISSIHAANGTVTHHVGTFTDVTHSQEHMAQMEYLANYDSLTDLPNRSLLADRLRHAMTRARRTDKKLAICYLDLDGFKPVNDQCGHMIGDELLILAARRMSVCLRSSDTLARVGGDEFAMLLCDLNESSAHISTLKRVLQALDAPFLLADQSLRISASIGVVIYPDDFVNAEELMKHADMAMYAAKNAGGNTYRTFSAELVTSD